MTRLLHSTTAAAAIALLASAALPAQAAGPAYNWSNVKIGGTGYVTGMVSQPRQQGLFYARTDMGGAYRYQASSSTWIPLTDWVSAPNANQLGIDSLATDPNDASRLYMVVGTYYWAPKATLLSSTNQGASFQQVTLPFSTGSNEGGRQVGERLQVDPNNGAVLFYGTGNYAGNASTNGLWTSTDRGATWNKSTGLPALSSDGTGAGVAFVAFHAGSGMAGQATPTLFAAINSKSASDSGAVLYRSNDAGKTWAVVNGAPRGVLPQRGSVGSEGNLYITFSAPATYTENGVSVTHYDGPNGLMGGQVWKYNVYSGAWTNITPASNGSNSGLGYGFSGLSVDPWRPGTVLVETIDRWSPGDTVYRTTDGGTTWTDLGLNASFDVSAAPWTTTFGPVTSWGNWLNSVLDPYDPNHAFVAWGGGIKESKNLTAAKTNWAYGMNGIEETAVDALVSPTANAYTAYPLISGAGDVCGFAHASITTTPSGEFANPICSRTTSLAYAANDSRIVVRVGDDLSTTDPASKHYGAISWNGGYSWSPFASNASSTTQGGGVVTIGVDTSTILWSPPDVAPAYSTNAGYSWNSLAGTLPKGALVAADGYNANLFYAYDPATGTFYSSANKATGWVKAATLPSAGRQVASAPGVQGDVWVVAEWSGLYHDSSSGWGGWPRVAGVEIVRAIGFGKAAPGNSYPTVYLSGNVNGVDGYFRSIDAGASWVRINDDQHQWGGSYVITGDPKTFGTVYIGTNGRGIMSGTSAN